jgi:hypothetical protein
MVLCLVLVSVSQITCSGERPRDPGRYYHEAQNFSIAFPDGWRVVEGDGIDAPLVEAVSPWEDEADPFSEHISISVEDFAKNVDLEKFFETLREQDAREFSYYEEGEIRDARVDGEDAKFSIFDIGMEEGNNRVLSCTIVKGKKGYLISCVAEASKYELYEPVFEAALGSFRFE